MQGLVHGAVPDAVDCLLPNGDTVRFAVNDGRCDVSNPEAPPRPAMVIKDAGDDPDYRQGPPPPMCVCCPARPVWCACVAALVWAPSPWPGWGSGSGPRHQPLPRRNIEDNVRAAGAPLLAHAGWRSPSPCPRGVEMARKGCSTPAWAFWAVSPSSTTGIVKPYSTSAYRASVVQGDAGGGPTLGHGVVVLTTGGRTEQFAMKERAGLPRPALCRWATSALCAR